MDRINVARRGVCSLVLTIVATLAHGAEPGSSADGILDAASKVMQQIDQNQYTQVWQDAVPLVKARFTQDGFVNALSHARQLLGKVAYRGWSAVVRLQYSHSQAIPDGLYANVDYTTTLADGRVTYEFLTLELGKDGHWHFVGYVPHSTPGVVVSPGATGQP